MKKERCRNLVGLRARHLAKVWGVDKSKERSQAAAVELWCLPPKKNSARGKRNNRRGVGSGKSARAGE